MFDYIVKEFEGKSDRHLLHKILEQNNFIISKLAIIMGQNEDFTAALDKLDADIQAVAAALAAAIGSVPAGALTADQAAALIARISGEQATLEGLVTPPPPPPPPAG